MVQGVKLEKLASTSMTSHTRHKTLAALLQQHHSVVELLHSNVRGEVGWAVPLLVLDFALDVVDGVGRLDLEGDSLTCSENEL